jgi:hypothetical protein
VLTIQEQVNRDARAQGRHCIDLINEEERKRILSLTKCLITTKWPIEKRKEIESSLSMSRERTESHEPL